MFLRNLLDKEAPAELPESTVIVPKEETNPNHQCLHFEIILALV